MTFTHGLSINNYGTTKLIVATNPANGTHTTLASAMAVAVSGDTIFVRNSVTEDVTLTPGVNVVSYVGSQITPTVSITGKLTMTGVGSCTISGIRLTTNSDFSIVVSGSAASVLNLENCYLNCSNNTGISFTSSSSSSSVNLFECKGNLGTTGIALFAKSSAGTMSLRKIDIGNSGSSLSACTISSGTVDMEYCILPNAITTSSTGILSGAYNTFNLQSLNTTCLTIGGGVSSIVESSCYSGTASAISIGSTLALYGAVISSSNMNAITGAGTLIYGGVSFISSSNTINTVTQTPIAWTVPQGGTGLTSPGASGNVLTSNGTIWTSSTPTSFTQINVQVFTSDDTYTPTTGMKYCIIEAVGGGGGGAGCPATSATQVSAGGGGGGAGYQRGLFTDTDIGASQIVTIGTGGIGGTGNDQGDDGTSTTVGALITGEFGAGGGNAGASAAIQASGGVGGGGAGGNFTSRGLAGGNAFGISLTTVQSVNAGWGGASFFGGSREAKGTTGASTQSNGNDGGLYGQGGGGAYSSAGGTAADGGAGADGIVVVTEFI